MIQLMIAGAGQIGDHIAHWLASCGDYQIFVVDRLPARSLSQDPSTLSRHQLDVGDEAALTSFLDQYHIESLVSCLPYTCNQSLLKIAHQKGINYFDLTEDRSTALEAMRLSQQATTLCAPQCGLAPGFINIIAHHLMQSFEQVERVELRCGALPATPSSPLGYALTWSPDGVINEYLNPCEIIKEGQLQSAPGLADVETLAIDGQDYECFNTSGGLGSLAETCLNHVTTLNYKTIRYPGHAAQLNFLLEDLNLKNNRTLLKELLTYSVPSTNDDKVVIQVKVSGYNKGIFSQQEFTNTFYPTKLFNQQLTAIQLTTTAGACSVIDIVLNNPAQYKGFIAHTAISLEHVYANRFGHFLQINA